MTLKYETICRGPMGAVCPRIQQVIFCLEANRLFVPTFITSLSPGYHHMNYILSVWSIFFLIINSPVFSGHEISVIRSCDYILNSRALAE